MDDKTIYEWLKTQKYQTEYEYTGEYRMYFEVDMPKILRDYFNWAIAQKSEGKNI